MKRAARAGRLLAVDGAQDEVRAIAAERDELLDACAAARDDRADRVWSGGRVGKPQLGPET